jgi:hypothetical protein
MCGLALAIVTALRTHAREDPLFPAGCGWCSNRWKWTKSSLNEGTAGGPPQVAGRVREWTGRLVHLGSLAVGCRTGGMAWMDVAADRTGHPDEFRQRGKRQDED